MEFSVEIWTILLMKSCKRETNEILELLVGLVGFYGISTFVGYLMPNPFYVNNQFYFKQFSLAWEHSLIVKAFLFQTIQAVIYNNSV